MSKERFVVKDVVCDYGVFDTEFPEEGFICVCKARANALLVADILNADYQKPNECVYWKDQQIVQLKAELEQYKKHENHSCNSVDEMIKQCDECKFCECIGCEYSNSAVEEIKALREFAEKLDAEFGKDAEPTLSERADNIIALYRTNKKYCEYAESKIKELECGRCGQNQISLETCGTQKCVSDLQQQLKEKDEEIAKLKEGCKSAVQSFNRMETLYKLKCDQLELNTKQVCEKIREEMGMNHKENPKSPPFISYVNVIGLEKILNRIEEGEIK